MSTDTESYDEVRPVFYIGQHDSARTEPLTDLQYRQVLDAGVSRPPPQGRNPQTLSSH